jgi:hypothetical protein
MSDKFEKQPWNPFPLHSLSAHKKYGLSARAVSVLIYLAARSNYTGWTSVGHARIAYDLVRSKDFVTRGLQELYAKGVVKVSRRARKGKLADSRVITKDILSEEYRVSSPEQQDQTVSSPDFDDASGPEQQEYKSVSSPAFPVSSPAMQGETLQNYNLQKVKSSTLQKEQASEASRTNEVSVESKSPGLQEKYESLDSESKANLCDIGQNLSYELKDNSYDILDVYRIYDTLCCEPGGSKPDALTLLIKIFKGDLWKGVKSKTVESMAFRLSARPREDGKTLLQQFRKIREGQLRTKAAREAESTTGDKPRFDKSEFKVEVFEVCGKCGAELAFGEQHTCAEKNAFPTLKDEEGRPCCGKYLMECICPCIICHKRDAICDCEDGCTTFAPEKFPLAEEV